MLEILALCSFHSKQITENRCLHRCIDVSLDIARQINALWEPLRHLAPLFNINTKADFLVNPLKRKKERKLLFVSNR